MVAKSWPTGPNLDVTAFSRRWYRSCHDHEDNPRILTLSRRSKGKGVEQVLLINSYIAYYVNITLRFCGDYSKGIIIGKLKWKLPNKSLDILPHNGDWDPVSLTLFFYVSLFGQFRFYWWLVVISFDVAQLLRADVKRRIIHIPAVVVALIFSLIFLLS